MKSLIVFCVLFLLPLTACAAPNMIVQKAHNATHRISNSSMLGGGVGSCSATAIGPHALLTAAHCEVASDSLTVDDKTAHVEGTIGDGLDHVIYLLSDVTFKDIAQLSDDTQQYPGDRVFVFGNPGQFRDMYREGYVSGFESPNFTNSTSIPNIFQFLAPVAPKEVVKAPAHKRPVVTFYDLNGFFGDSGSALFNDEGKIVAVTSFIQHNERDGYENKFMGSFELRFKKKQLKEAMEFNP